MKRLTFLLLMLFAISANAQNSYSEAIQQGEAAFKNGQYKTAINKYFAAEAFDPSKKEIVKSKVNGVFDKIETLREEAESAKKQAQSALSETKKAKDKAQNSLQKANRLINAFYFYENKFALAYGPKGEYDSNVFYFIDKNGNEVTKLGQWKIAEQFKRTGFAQVKEKNTNHLTDYLLDTLGNKYLVAFDVKDLNDTVTALDLSENKFVYFPDKILNYFNLEILFLQDNNLNNLPSKIGQLEKLTKLYLGGNKLTNLPEQIGMMRSLSNLDLSDNQISQFPEQFKQLDSLSELNLSNNELSNVPEPIWQLKNLTVLDLSGNQLTSLPEQIWQLKNLTVLDLSGNQLTSLPEQIWQLKNLTVLNLSDNQLTSLPEQIWQLKNLTFLDLSHTSIERISEKIASLKYLSELKLSGNFLSSLPEQFWEMKSLTILDLSDNLLGNPPDQIWQLKNLTRLNLGDNLIFWISEEITRLENLMYLDLSGSLYFPEEDVNKLKLLLPTCEIEFIIDNESVVRRFEYYHDYYDGQKEALALNENDTIAWEGLSYYALFNDEPKEAINAAKKTLTLKPDALYLETYLAFGYLLDNKWEAAKKIFLKWKGKKFPDKEYTCDDRFIELLLFLEKAGIYHQDFEKVRELFSK